MRIAFVGCGYAADLYALTLPNHPSLELVGAYDRDAARQKAFTAHHDVNGFPTLAALVADPAVELVVNLTNPSSHAEVNRAALLAGKHVYVEKPIALELAEARELARLAADRGLVLGAAPCNLLGETAQTLWRALRDGAIGTPRLAYAELDAGPILQAPFHTWVSVSGAPWPHLDEFVTGCTIEHAAYYLTWLTAFFGPATQVTAFAASVAPNSYLAAAGHEPTPNFSVAAISFADGVVARVTSGLVAPRDHSLRVIGDDGVITVTECGDYESPLTITRGPQGTPTALPLVRTLGRLAGYDDAHTMDFARGIADVAGAAAGVHLAHLPTDHALHVLELTLTIARATAGVVVHPQTSFVAVPPMPWAS